jgi:hypothetical protein
MPLKDLEKRREYNREYQKRYQKADGYRERQNAYYRGKKRIRSEGAKEKIRQQNRERYKKDREDGKSQKYVVMKIRNKKYIDQYKLEHPCQCGESNITCLEFQVAYINGH